MCLGSNRGERPGNMPTSTMPIKVFALFCTVQIAKIVLTLLEHRQGTGMFKTPRAEKSTDLIWSFEICQSVWNFAERLGQDSSESLIAAKED